MRIFCRGLLATVLAAMLLASTGTASSAAKISERTRQKQAAEAQRVAVQNRLDALKRSISQTEVATDKATEALGKSAQAISRADRSLHELDIEQHDTERTLEQLTAQQALLTKQVAQQQTSLSTVVRDHYMAGSGDRIQLLLSGDNPNRINRDMQYLGYVSQAQAKLIASLRVNLQKIDADKAAAQEARDALDDIAKEARDQRTLLQQEKKRHNVQLASLSSKLATQRKQAGELQRDDQRLTGLVSKLDALIEEQRKADLAAAEQRQARKLAEAKAAQNRRKTTAEARAARHANPKATPSREDAIDDDPPPNKLAQRNELRPENAVDSPVAGNFEALRGQLHLPVRGDITLKFGGSRGDGPSSKGVFIRTADGADIRAIAPGRVVFADWLRGFGNLIIVDHGSQYLTVYGNNQSVLKHPGDIVKTGDTIARSGNSAGNSNGNEQSGLYFEIRHQGRAFDPMTWVTTR
jgi:septal ring factor EnvC (AmiA/AmiB activator)